MSKKYIIGRKKDGGMFRFTRPDEGNNAQQH